MSIIWFAIAESPVDCRRRAGMDQSRQVIVGWRRGCMQATKLVREVEVDSM